MSEKYTAYGVRELKIYPYDEATKTYSTGLVADGVSAFSSTPVTTSQDLVGNDRIMTSKSFLEAYDISFENGYWDFETLNALDASVMSVDGKVLTTSAGQKKQPYGVLARVFVEEGDDLVIAFPFVKTQSITEGYASQAFAKCAVTAKALADDKNVFRKLLRTNAALDKSMFTAEEAVDITAGA